MSAFLTPSRSPEHPGIHRGSVRGPGVFVFASMLACGVAPETAAAPPSFQRPFVPPPVWVAMKAPAAPPLFRPVFIPIPAGGGPVAVACADLNRDGVPDLVTANTDASTVSVLLRGPGGTDLSRADFATGTNPGRIALADLDGDGRLDIVVACPGAPGITALLGSGDGTFGDRKDLAVAGGVGPFAIGDVNGDGHPDLAVVRSPSSLPFVRFYDGVGDGTFREVVPAAGSQSPVALGGESVSKPRSPARYWQDAVALGDVNADGRLDIAISNHASTGRNSISVGLGNGDGTFQTVTENYSISLAPTLVDVNSDGRADLIAATSGGASVWVFLSRGDGTFDGSGPYDTGGVPRRFAVGDANRDGLLDLAAMNAAGRIVVLPGIGGGLFAPGTRYDPVNDCSDLVLEDLTGDGWPDLVTADRVDNAVAVIAGNRDGTFGVPRYATGAGPSAIAVGDLNGDGRPDLAVADRRSGLVSVLLGNGDGSLRPRSDFLAGPSPSSVAIADFNDDGRSDLALTNSTIGPAFDMVTMLPGNGDGSFAPNWSFRTGAFPVFVAAADLNADGRQDMVVANQGAGTVSVLLGNGNGTFAPKADFPTGAEPSWIAIGDLNGDAKPDLAVATTGGPATVSVLLGNGDGTLLPRTDFGSGHGISVAIGDLNGDRRPDLAVATSAGKIEVIAGDGDGRFGPEALVAMGASPSAVAIADLDADGLSDLVVTNRSANTASVLLGVRGGTFRSKLDVGVGFFPRSLAVADMNLDGGMDLVVADSVANTVSVLPNTRGSAGVPAPRTTRGVLLAPVHPDPAPQVSNDVSVPLETLNPIDVPERPDQAQHASIRGFPNPAFSSLSIRFEVTTQSTTSLRVYDAAGRVVRTLLEGSLAPGVHVAGWDLRDAAGRRVRAGVYVCAARVHGAEVARRILVLP